MALKEAMLAEKHTIKIASRVVRRDPSKYIGKLKLYPFSLLSKNCEMTSVARVCYFWVRAVDDILDGDMQVPDGRNALDYINTLIGEIQIDSFSNKPLSQMAQYVIHSLEKRQRPDDNVRQDFLAAFDPLIFDHIRMQERSLLSQREIDMYYQSSFGPLLNIMFIGLSSSFRASDIPELATVQGRTYSIRDLASDWNKGIINIPREVLATESLSPSNTIHEVATSPFVTKWIDDQMVVAKDEISINPKHTCRMH